MNSNVIATDRFSNPESEKVYRSRWPEEADIQRQYEEGNQCGGCSYFAPLNEDWGICCNSRSRHRLETVFEHFTCPSFSLEGWGPHSFSDSYRCECEGKEIQKNPNQSVQATPAKAVEPDL